MGANWAWEDEPAGQLRNIDFRHLLEAHLDRDETSNV
jgi:hypothetical protein